MPRLDLIYKPKESSLISEQVGADLVSHPVKLIRSNSPKDRITLDKGCSEYSRRNLLEVALFYAESGIYVFPCKVGLKTPACKNGHLDATRDPDQIKKWWADFPYNVGINTELSGLVVVDQDVVAGRAVGSENFQKLLGYEPLNTLAVTTRSGGKQYYFKAPSIPIKCSTSKICDKVDIKAVGGYVIAPPSYVEADEKSGAGCYSFDKKIEPSGLPSWLENHLIALQQPNSHKKHEGHATDIFLKSDNYFPCNETNREKLRIAVRQRRKTHDCSSQDAWVQLLFEFRSLVFLVGWPDQEAWTLFDEICRLENMGNYHEINNRKRWDVDDFRPDGRSYKSLLDELSKQNITSKALSAPLGQLQPTPFSLKNFSMQGQAEVMKKKMLDDIFVLAFIALLGQATTIYARANTGKTLLVLWMLIESIIEKRIKGENVIYVNADDTFSGFIQKLELAEKYGFHMLMPNQNGFEPQAMQGYLRQMIDDDTARNSIIILDTLKKFTDLMDKKAGSGFMSRVREFIAAGGTIISLAHTNKNKNGEGKSVFCGTSDIVDDCDCVYILDTVSTTDSVKVVLFENIKNRGNVVNELSVSYSVAQGVNYLERFNSIKIGSETETLQAKVEISVNAELNNDKASIQAITEAIEAVQGSCIKTELIKSAHEGSNISRRLLLKTLEKYTGILWVESKGDKNSHSYELIKSKQSLTMNNTLN